MFFIYFIGRIITIIRLQGLETNEIHIGPAGTHWGVDEIVEYFCIDDNPTYTILIKSKTGIRSLKIYKIIYDSNMNRIGRKVTGHSLSFLNVGHAITISLALPEILPWYEVEYCTMDYKKVKIELVDNLKSGIITEGLKAKHTFKSVIYNLLK